MERPILTLLIDDDAPTKLIARVALRERSVEIVGTTEHRSEILILAEDGIDLCWARAENDPDATSIIADMAALADDIGCGLAIDGVPVALEGGAS